MTCMVIPEGGGDMQSEWTAREKEWDEAKKRILAELKRLKSDVRKWRATADAAEAALKLVTKQRDYLQSMIDAAGGVG